MNPVVSSIAPLSGCDSFLHCAPEGRANSFDGPGQLSERQCQGAHEVSLFPLLGLYFVIALLSDKVDGFFPSGQIVVRVGLEIRHTSRGRPVPVVTGRWIQRDSLHPLHQHSQARVLPQVVANHPVDSCCVDRQSRKVLVVDAGGSDFLVWEQTDELVLCGLPIPLQPLEELDDLF